MTENAAATVGGTTPPAVSAVPGRPPAKVYLEQLAKLMDLPYETVRAYHNRAMQRRRAEADGRPWKHLSGDNLPEPDGHDPNPLSPRDKPYWYRSTLRPYLAARQRGGGRPRSTGEPAQARKRNPRTPGPKPGMHRYAGGRPAAPPGAAPPVTWKSPVTGEGTRDDDNP